MNALKKIALAILLLSLIVFIALFGSLPALRKTPIGFFSRFIWRTLPAALRSLDITVTGGRFGSSLLRWGSYFMNENHPAILIFYISVLSGSIILFIPAAFVRVSNFQLALLVVLCILPYYLTYMTVTSTSSVITQENHSRELLRYPYDHALYEPGQICRTCHFLKPARSKHCSICNVCVSKHDHHCVWIMNCVGKANAFYFMAMLASLGTLMNYGAYLAYLVTLKTIKAEVARQTGNLDPPSNWGAGKTWSEYGEFHLWAFAQDFRIGAVGMLAFLCGPLAWALFLYHTYLVWAGMTTNETSKWADWRDDIADGIVFKARRTMSLQNVRDTSIEPFVKWPNLSTQQLLRSENGDPQRLWADGQDKPPFGKDALRRVKGLEEIDNLYDLGFWKNLKDMAPL